MSLRQALIILCVIVWVVVVASTIIPERYIIDGLLILTLGCGIGLVISGIYQVHKRRHVDKSERHNEACKDDKHDAMWDEEEAWHDDV